MIGLSISFCVRDIADGKVAYDDVQVILAGTNMHMMGDVNAGINRVVESYREIYWAPKVTGVKMLPDSQTGNLLDELGSDRPDRCEAIFRRLLAEGKIFEARAHGGEAPFTGLGHWLHTRMLNALLEDDNSFHENCEGYY
jgi:hypothetical protein